MTESSRRPAGVTAPAHLSPSPPVPEPEQPKAQPDLDGLSPVRYGDWEKKGIAIDF
ncbi:DUF1674 domain-containing protein [uncultured Sphingomonas sp.]|uniref:DUF1674 domain-containing protein n=1 Tax=uncultured Sphingomonas sp. TaxID=158754 RepID=UPI0025EA933F|nr:DUF1674 domain-containing protein [uncultured Sphingomonas sp.]